MSGAKRSPALQGIEVRLDSKKRKRYRGTARDRKAGKHLKGPWTSSLAEARAWRVDALARLQAGTLSGADAPTVKEGAAEMIAEMRAGVYRLRNGQEYKPRQISELDRQLKARVLPEFGATRVNRLERPRLQSWVDEFSSGAFGEGRQGKGRLAPSTIRGYVAALRALIAFAELRGWVHVNPCDGLRIPTGEVKRDRIADPTEAATLIDAMQDRDKATLAIAVYAGLRIGEILALDVRDINLEDRWIHVHRNWDKHSKKFVPTKSRKPRQVPIIERLAGVLRDHLLLRGHPTKGLLFPSTKRPDWPVDPGVLRKRTLKRWEESGLAPLGFHEGRHTYASIAIAAGLNAKTLSTYLGHATINITLDRYGHLMPGSEVEARALLDDYLSEH